MLRSLIAVAVISFALHYLWESLHIVLYTGYEGISGPLPVTLYASLGDVGYTLLAFLFFACIYRDWRWAEHISTRTLVFLAALGLCIALGVEWKAMLQHRWEYTAHMPTVFGFGLSPLLQMIVLLPLSIYLTGLYTAKSENLRKNENRLLP